MQRKVGWLYDEWFISIQVELENKWFDMQVGIFSKVRVVYSRENLQIVFLAFGERIVLLLIPRDPIDPLEFDAQ
jgi:hypothetical protein